MEDKKKEKRKKRVQLNKANIFIFPNLLLIYRTLLPKNYIYKKKMVQKLLNYFLKTVKTYTKTCRKRSKAQIKKQF
jgi:hypothetical protein